MTSEIKIALSKGRIFKYAQLLFDKIGLVPVDDPLTSRKLILDTNHEHIKLIVMRAADVPIYVQWGAADCGVTGKDVLMEHGGDNLYEPLDLDIAKCRMMVCGFADAAYSGDSVRVATKYAKTTQRFFAKRGQQVELIKLYGAMELAPIAGLADVIVDLVETGNTLKANGLVALEHMHDISSRLIVNKASWKLKHTQLSLLIEQLKNVIENTNA